MYTCTTNEPFGVKKIKSHKDLKIEHFLELVSKYRRFPYLAAVFFCPQLAKFGRPSLRRSTGTPTQYDRNRTRRVALPASKKCCHLNYFMHTPFRDCLL